MKKILFIILPIVLIVFSAVLISCDILLPAPLGRNNPFDDEAQIGRFNVAVSGSDSIVTYWEWHDALPIIDADRVFDKIRIVHSQNDRPTGIGLLIDENVQEFTSTNDWQFNWTGLKNGRDHHFALYAHEKGGLWLAPKYAVIDLSTNTPERHEPLYPQSPPNNPEEFTVYEVSNLPFTTSDETFSAGFNLSPGNYLVLEFNIKESIYFQEFLLQLKNLVPGGDANLSIYALKKNLSWIIDWADMISDDTIDYNFVLQRQVTIAGGADQVIDIADIANRMSLFYSHSIVIVTDTPVTLDINNWIIDTHFWGD